MAILPKALGQAALTVADQTIYTVPAATRATVRNIRVCNTTAAVRLVSVYLVPAAGAPADANAILKDFAVPANGVVDDDGIHTREAGGMLIAHADAVGLTLTASGAEIT